MKHISITVSFALLAGLVFAPPVNAQRHGGFAAGSAHIGHPAGIGHPGLSRGHLGRAYHRHGSAYYSPYFFSDYGYDDDYGYDPETGEALPPPVIVRQAAPPAPAAKPADSLLLELQGDRWVRVTNQGQSQIGVSAGAAYPVSQSNAAPSGTSLEPRFAQPSALHQLPAAVLVFRDGRQEEIRKYVIRSAAIFVGPDYSNGDPSQRKIALVDLDLPATLKLNQQRGTHFTLPSGPNEVVFRP